MNAGWGNIDLRIQYSLWTRLYACLWFGVLGLSVVVWVYGWHGYCWHGVVMVIVTLLILLWLSTVAHVYWVSCTSCCSGPRVPGIVGCFKCFCSCVIELFRLLSIGCSSRWIYHNSVIRRPSGHHSHRDGSLGSEVHTSKPNLSTLNICDGKRLAMYIQCSFKTERCWGCNEASQRTTHKERVRTSQPRRCS